MAGTVQSIERAFEVLNALSQEELGVTDLADRVDLPKSTVARLLKTLESMEVVKRSPDARYRVGPALGRLAGASSASAALISRARPHLMFLADSVGEDAGLSVPDGYLVHYIDQVDSGNAVQVRDWTGELVEMHAVPSGLVLLAHWPEERLARFLRRPLKQYTGLTVTDPDLIRRRLVEVRRDRHAWVVEEFAEGIASVAAPILDKRGRPVAALHVHGPAYRFGKGSGNVAGLVMERADLLSAQLGS